MAYFLAKYNFLLFFFRINLYELIKKNNFQGFSLSLIRRFAISLLVCMRHLHSEKIIHCDLKPVGVKICKNNFLILIFFQENILLRQRGQSSIKVIDFGSSCYEHQRVYTYIQSRFYRSPEVILGLPYSMPIDMWSLGCILAELYTGYPLFPGENEIEQLACIMEIFGLPPQNVLDQASRRRLFFGITCGINLQYIKLFINIPDSKGYPRTITNSKGKKRRPSTKDLAGVLKTNDANFLDFLRRCLEWDPVKRMTPDEAMDHDWIREGIQNKTRQINASQQSRIQQSRLIRKAEHKQILLRGII